MKNILLLSITFLCCLCTALPATAQTNGEYPATFQTNGMTAVSQVFKDSRIDLLIQKQVYINSLALRNIPGFRVQVISTMNRNKATEAKARLMQLFPDYSTYLSYQSPYFRVRIGDFRSRDAAEKLQQELNTYFPNGVFTVRDIIHISPEQLLQNPNANAND
jgi:hypothetical protein